MQRSSEDGRAAPEFRLLLAREFPGWRDVFVFQEDTMYLYFQEDTMYLYFQN